MQKTPYRRLFFRFSFQKTAGKASVLSFYQADFLVMKLLGSSLIGLLQCTVYACRILSAGLSHARTAAAAARERNTMDRKPMRAGIWVKLLRAEA